MRLQILLMALSFSVLAPANMIQNQPDGVEFSGDYQCIIPDHQDPFTMVDVLVCDPENNKIHSVVPGS